MLVTRNIWCAMWKSNNSHISFQSWRSVQSLWHIVHVLADLLVALLVWCNNSAHPVSSSPKICPFSCSRTQSRTMCFVMKTPAFLPLVLGLEVVKDRCKLQFVSQVPVVFLGFQFISIDSHLSLLSNISSFPFHLLVWLIQKFHTSGSTLRAEPTPCRDWATSSYIHIQVLPLEWIPYVSMYIAILLLNQTLTDTTTLWGRKII